MFKTKGSGRLVPNNQNTPSVCNSCPLDGSDTELCSAPTGGVRPCLPIQATRTSAQITAANHRLSGDLVVAHRGTCATLLFLFLCVAAAQDEKGGEVHLGVVHSAPKCHCKLFIQMTPTLADGSDPEADGDLPDVFSFLILLALVAPHFLL